LKLYKIIGNPAGRKSANSAQEALATHGLHPGRAARAKRIAELLETVGLRAEHASRFPHEFSGGQRQRIGVARALAVEPEFIVADEPLSALDVSIQSQVINLLADLRERLSLTMLFISHDLDVVQHLCDRVVVLNYGSKLVNIVADKTQVGSLGAVGYDDEGVKCGQWDIVKDGILVNYQTIRDQAHILGLNASQGCCYADNWSSVQFQRMPNISLQPGKEKKSVDDLIKGVEKGIYIIGDGSFSIDQQRYNFQFGGQLFYEIKNGKIAGMLKDVAYQSNTQEFWNSCAGIADQSDYRLGGSFFDGKGQPPQSSAVSHGCATARFNGVNVINTSRKIG